MSPKTLSDKKIVRLKKGTNVKVKVLGEGTITKKLTVSGCAVSKTAKEAIEKAGGNVA